MSDEQVKKCPFCAEEIKFDAIVCRFCGRDLDQGQTSRMIAVEATKKKFKKHTVIAIALVVVGFILIMSGMSTAFSGDAAGAVKFTMGFFLLIIGCIWGLVNRIRIWWDRG